MTPLHLDILMHYFVLDEDYKQIESNKTRLEYAYELAEIGYLYTPNETGKRFAITRCGSKFAQSILDYARENSGL